MTDVNTKVELMAQDITYIKKELQEIKEFMRVVVEEKADKVEVDRLRVNQDKVIWLIVSTVIVAILGLIVKNSLL
jgi:hypothetical protein